METLKTMDNIRVGMQTLEVQNASWKGMPDGWQTACHSHKTLLKVSMLILTIHCWQDILFYHAKKLLQFVSKIS